MLSKTCAHPAQTLSMVFLGCLFGLLSSCSSAQNPPNNLLTCQSIDALREVNFEALTLGNFPQWVENQYTVSETALTTWHPQETMTEIHWNVDDQRYAAFFEEEHLLGFGLGGLSNKITFGQLFKCFGIPNLYGAYLISRPSSKNYDLFMFYPELGVIGRFSYSDMTLGSPPLFSDALPIEVIIVKPGTLEFILATAYIPGTESLPPAWPQFIKEWSGDWSTVQLNELP